jgi:hypothetical protein
MISLDKSLLYTASKLIFVIMDRATVINDEGTWYNASWRQEKTENPEERESNLDFIPDRIARPTVSLAFLICAAAVSCSSPFVAFATSLPCSALTEPKMTSMSSRERPLVSGMRLWREEEGKWMFRMKEGDRRDSQRKSTHSQNINRCKHQKNLAPQSSHHPEREPRHDKFYHTSAK